MPLDDRFDDLVASLTGFYRAWVIQLGIELGLFARLREAGPGGLTRDGLALAAKAAAEPVSAWCDAAYAADLITDDGSRVIVDPDVATILLEKDRTEYLGGQFTYTVTASLDYDRMAEYLRTGVPVGSRSARYYRAIEELTRQDIAVFFEEALAAMPDLVADLVRGIDVIDLHCGGGRWLAAIARRFPKARLVGVEPELESVTRATQLVQRAGLGSRIRARLARWTRTWLSGPSTWPTSSMPCTRCRTPSWPSRRRGACIDHAAGSSSWAGACRTGSMDTRPSMGSSSRASRSTSCSTGHGCARSRSTPSCSAPPACPSRRRSRSHLTRHSSWPAAAPDAGA